MSVPEGLERRLGAIVGEAGMVRGRAGLKTYECDGYTLERSVPELVVLPATTDEVRASALQFVRKLSGFTKPSRANQEAFDLAVERVAATAQELLDSLVTEAPPKNREEEAAKASASAAASASAGARNEAALAKQAAMRREQQAMAAMSIWHMTSN